MEKTFTPAMKNDLKLAFAYAGFFVLLVFLYRLWQLESIHPAWKILAASVSGALILKVLGVDQLISFGGFCMLLTGLNFLAQSSEVSPLWKVLGSLIVVLQFGTLGKALGSAITSKLKVNDREKLAEVNDKIIRLMESEKLFKEQGLSISRLAEKLMVKSYVVSAAINEFHQKSFSEFINRYRIKEAEHMLLAKEFAHFSIDAIAFDCGFNTPSAFYASFNRIHNFSPTEFRARNQKK